MMKRLMLLLLLFAPAASLRAREVYPLNEGWRFFFKTENTSDRARHVTLPHSWNTDAMAEGLFVTTTGNYQNDMYIPAEWASKRVFVRFYGVQSVADLFINGHHAGAHRGGATAFTIEITDKLDFGADNALLVVVTNGFRDDVLPTSTDINLYGGIYREAELIVTEPTAISPLYLGTDGILVRPTAVDEAEASGEVEVHLTARRSHNATLTLSIAAPDGRRVFERRQRVHLDGRPVLMPFSVARPERWSPGRPALYTVTASVEDGTTRDSASVRTGFRSVVVTPDGGLQINGRREPVRGVSVHHDNALSAGTLTTADYDADLATIRDLGATALRSAVMPHAQYLYDRCDEQGILAWIDIPFHRAFLGDVAYYSTPQFERNGLQQLREIVAQNINHPSVVMWGIFSHLWLRGDNVVPYLRRLDREAKTLDPTRPTVACSDQDGDLNFVTDLIVWHQKVGWSHGSTDDVALWRNMLQKKWSQLKQAVCYGGSGIIGHKSYTAQAAPRSNWMPESRQTLFHEEYARNLQGDSLFWGTWIANLFDYGSSRRAYGINAEGLVTLDRRERKDAYYLYRALWNRTQPTLHISDSRRTLRDEERLSFRIYSSAGTPLLLLNGDTVRVQRYADCQYRSDTVAVHGRVKVKALADTLRDSITLRAGNVLKPKRQPGLPRTAGPQRTN